VPEAINNIGMTFARQGNDKLALEYYFKSLKAARENNNRRAQALALFNIDIPLFLKRNMEKPKKYLLAVTRSG